MNDTNYHKRGDHSDDPSDTAPCDCNNPKTSEVHSIKSFLQDSLKGQLEVVVSGINVHELAERVVIEYANTTGRDDNRPDVRNAVIKVLTPLLEEKCLDSVVENGDFCRFHSDNLPF